MLIINEITTLIDSLCVESTQVVLDNLKGERLHGSSALVIAAGIGFVGSVIGGIFGASSASKRAKRAEREKRRLTGELDTLEKNRQSVINPYAGVTDLSSMVSDLSSMANNPFNSLGVATGAAEMQAEQTDLALANTLDTIRASGASAGGATALARMAMESKKDVSADIEKQEAANQKLRAQGEQNLQSIKMNEAKRVQGALMGEAGRQQEADVAGSKFVFGEKERRETEQMNRKQAQITGQAQAAAQARSDQSAAISGTVSAVGNIAGSYMSAKAKPPSDRRLKNSIKIIGVSESGLKIYSFKYNNIVHGEGTYQGVMSDEIPQEAVIKHFDGFDRVDYSLLDVDFKQIIKQ